MFGIKYCDARSLSPLLASQLPLQVPPATPPSVQRWLEMGHLPNDSSPVVCGAACFQGFLALSLLTARDEEW